MSGSNQVIANSLRNYYKTQESNFLLDAAQSIPNGTSGEIVLLNDQQTSPLEIFGLSVNAGVFTATQQGLYTISCTIVFAADVVGQRGGWIKKNASVVRLGENQYNAGLAASRTEVQINFTSIIFAGDTFSILCFQNSGDFLNIDSVAQGAEAHTRLTITKTGL